jgi:ubiquinone/menaquinone biosynthesis C-methylase UbiE
MKRNWLGLFVTGFLIVSAMLLTTALSAQEREQESQKDSRRKPLSEYMGREIAPAMGYMAADWLVRAEREREERCSMVLANLGLKTGMTVCDMGCGNGFYALPIAKLLGKNGQVLGVDIQPEMLELLRKRMEEEQIDNVTPILGSEFDPRLPADSIDLVLMVDVYHEFSYPEEMLAAVHRSLKKDGLVVLVEYRTEDDNVPIKPEHKMSKAQVEKELIANGFKLVKEFDKLPWQHMLFYGKKEAP